MTTPHFKRPPAHELLLTTTKRKCERCGEDTYWMKRRQTKRGFCYDHALVEPVAEGDALKALLRAFPGSTITEGTAQPRYAPDSYGQERDVKVIDSSRWLISGKPHWSTTLVPPLDAGPCEGCRRTIRRYGPEGYPYCTECEPIS